MTTLDVTPAHAQASSCNIATNGSFESPNIQTTPQRAGENTAYVNGYAIWRTSTYPTDGWQTVSGTFDYLRYYNNASDGMQSIDLFGVSAATVRQTFTGLVPGQQYTFSIDYSGHFTTQAPALVQLGNGNGASPVTIASLRPVANSISNGNAGIPTTPAYTVTWATYQHTFTAAGTEATVQFVETGTGSTGLFIDNFRFAGTGPCSDLSITKTDGSTTFTRGAGVTYQIVVSNAGPSDAIGARITDPLPSGITTANWTCGSATNGAVCGAASGTGGIDTTANLPAGSSLTYTLTLTVPAGYSGVVLTNTATVAGPAGFMELDDSNNSASDTNSVSPPQPSFGACTSTMYLGVGLPTQLHSVDTSANPLTYPTIGSPYSPGYNAMGYDPLSNFIYAAWWDTATSIYRLLRVGGDGSVADLGSITGGGINTGGSGIASGEVGADGFFYVKRNTTTNQMWRIDLATRVATLITLSQSFASGDITWSNGLLYAQDHVTGFLVSVNPANGNVTPIGPSGFIGDADAFGSLMGASNGVFGRRNSGGFYKFDLSTGQATLISNAPAGSGDGAKCATTPVEFAVDLAISKTDGSTTYTPGANVVYTIVVRNNGPFGVQNAQVSDPLPAGITNATWTCGSATGGGVCDVASGTGAISTTADLPAGATVTYTLTMSVPAGFSGPLTNTASVTSPSGSPDTDGTNNTATDTDSRTPLLTLEKAVTNDNGGTATLADFTLSASGPTTISGTSGSAAVTAAPVSAGTYALSETNLPGYTASAYSCSIDGGAPVSGNSITLAADQAAVCTITNDDRPATLTLRKTVVNNHGGINAAADFTLTATGPTTISGATGTPAVTAASVPSGNYTLSETGPAGYTAGAYRCSINGGAVVVGNSLALANGDAAVCTITNDDIAPNVTIAKALVAETGAIAQTPEEGEQLTYEITLTNTGGTHSSYDAVDVLDSDVTFVSADNGGVLVGSEVQWNDLVVPAQDGATPGELVLTVVVTVNALAPGADITNIAKVPGPDPACPSAQCVVIPPPPFVEIDKTLTGESGAVPGVAEAGEQLSYRIRLSNLGSTTTTYALRDRLDANTAFVSADNGGVHSGDPAGGTIDWTNLTVPGESGGTPGILDITVVVTVANPLPAGVTRITNVAFDPGEPEPSCPSDQCAIVPVEGHVTIAKALTAENGTVAGVAEAGETLTYQITLTNTGGVDNSYAVQDVLDPNTAFASADNGGVDNGATVDWTGLTVPGHDGTNPGTLVLTVSVTVDDPLADGVFQLSNLAKVPGDPDPSCPSDQCVVTPAEPNVTIAKALTGETGTLPGIAEAGETLTYTITLTNTGGIDNNYALEDIVDPDTIFLGASNGGQLSGDRVTWTGLTVPAHDGTNPGTLTLAVTVEVDDPLGDGVSQISNIVKKPGDPDPACPSAQCVVTQVEPKVAPSKALTGESGAEPGVAEPGETLTYTITLTNQGGAASNYGINDVLDANTTFVSADNGGVNNAGTVEWTGLAVPAHDGVNPGTLLLTVVVTVDDPLPDGVSQVANLVKRPGDPDPACPSDQCVVTPVSGEVAKAKALVGESGSKAGVAEPGETLTYEITLTNVGGPAINYEVDDVLDPATNFVSATGGGINNGGTVEWRGLTVPAHDGVNPGTRVLTVVVTVDNPLPDGVTQLSNIAKEPGEPDPACPSAQCAVTPVDGKVSPAKALVGESGAEPGIAEPGETLTYEITLTNAGGAATGYAINDILDPNTTFVSADNGGLESGGIVEWTGLSIPAHDGVNPGTLVLTVVVTVADPLPTGVSQLSNIAKVPGDPDPVCPSAQCAVTPVPGSVVPVKQLVSESGIQQDVAEPGETLVYEITLSNSGGAASDYAIQDVLDPNTTFVSADNGGVDNGATVDWTGLTVPAHDGTSPGVRVLTVTVLVNDPLPDSVTRVANLVKVPGDPDPACPSDQCVITTTQDAALALAKTGTFEDSDGNGVSNAGDMVTYTLTVTNTGNVPVEDVAPLDAGPTFNGVPGENALSAFTPEMATLAPGAVQAFSAQYRLGQADVDNAAGIEDGVANTATARGYVGGNAVTGAPVESSDATSILVLPAASSDVSVAKVALLRHIRRGEEAPFAIRVTNHAGSIVDGLTIIDRLPPGFRYVEGSATIDDAVATPTVDGQRVVLENVSVPGNSVVEIRLRALALSSAGPGEHVNRASVTDAAGNSLAPDATASIEILAEPVFDCGDIVGRVFDDENRNGYQDEGELGLPGVRIATVNGWLVTTDVHGRFHVPCAALPDQRIGSNFIMKVDTRTLPTGYRLTTENPRVVRLTAGKMTELSFGASIGRVVRLDLQDGAFVPGELELRPEWARGIDQLIAFLAEEQSVLRLTYIDVGADPEFAEERLKHLRDLIGERWRQTSGQYRLEIEMRVETAE